MHDEPFEDLRSALEWGATLDLTPEQAAAYGNFVSRLLVST